MEIIQKDSPCFKTTQNFNKQRPVSPEKTTNPAEAANGQERQAQQTLYIKKSKLVG